MGFNQDLERWRHLTYVSMRLARHYLQLLEAAGATERVKSSFEIPLGDTGASVSMSAKSLDIGAAMENEILAARTLDECLRDLCVDLSRPVSGDAIACGKLVKASLLVQPAHLQVQNYELAHPVKDPYYVVGFTSVDQVPGLGRIFIGLVGSEHNLLKFPGEELVGARSASDSRGLYEMIQYTKEKYDVDINDRSIEGEFPNHYQDATEEQRLSLAANAFHGFAIRASPRPMEIMFEVHHVARNMDLETLGLQHFGEGEIALAIIGAPVWIREATDRVLISINDIISGPEVIEELWSTLDKELQSSIKDANYRSDWRPQSIDEWRHFGEWAAAWSKRIGGPMVAMTFRPKKYRLFGREYGGRSEVLSDSGITGWMIHDWGSLDCLVSDAGSIYMAVVDVQGAVVYSGADSGMPHAMAWDHHLAKNAVSRIIARITSWLLPFG